MDTKTICLGVLSLHDATGYEIKKQFEEGPFSFFYDAGYGSIYPALGKMLSDGLVTCVEVPQDGRPAKKVYSITETGRDVLRSALHVRPTQDKLRSDSLVMLFFGHLLESDQRAEVLDEYLAYYRNGLEYLATMDNTDSGDDQCFVHGMGVAVYEAAIRYLEENRQEFLDSRNMPEPKIAAGGGR